MRQRKLKNIEEKLAAIAPCTVADPRAHKGCWREVFGGKYETLYLELGCGKGNFLTGMAVAHPQAAWLGFEGQQSVVVAAGKKLMAEAPENARLVQEYVHDITEYFADGELDGLYLNFSDPWPKARHEKRRLTHRRYLEAYGKIVKPGGFVAFKTDNDGLFAFTVEEVAAMGYNVIEISQDLHSSPYADGNVMTEYEERFSGQGKNINYVKFKL